MLKSSTACLLHFEGDRMIFKDQPSQREFSSGRSRLPVIQRCLFLGIWVRTWLVLQWTSDEKLILQKSNIETTNGHI